MLKQQPMATDTAIKKMLTTDKNWDSDACMLYINAATNEQQYARERIQAKAHRRQGFAPENEMLFLADLKELGWQVIIANIYQNGDCGLAADQYARYT